MKSISTPIHYVAKGLSWLVGLVFLLVVLSFGRLLYGPVDVTWLTHIVTEVHRPPFLSQLKLALEDGHLNFQARLDLPGAVEENPPVHLYIRPNWLGLLEGELQFHEILLVAQDLNLGNLKAKPKKRPNTPIAFEKSWQSMHHALAKYLPKLAADGLTFSLQFQNLTLGRAGPENLPITLPSLRFSVHYLDSAGEILRLGIKLAEEAQLTNAALFPDRPLALKEIEGTLGLSPRGAKVEMSDIQLASARFALRADFAPKPKALDIALDLKSRSNIDEKTLIHLWPATGAEGGRAWVHDNFKRASVHGLWAQYSFRLDADGAFELPKLNGGFDIKEGILTYLGELPAILDLEATATFNLQGMAFQVTAGDVDGVAIKEGLVQLYDFDSQDQRIRIDVQLDGPVAKVLKIIDAAPLRYTRRVGLDPAASGGTTAAQLHFDFPLIRELSFSDVQLKIQGALERAYLSKLPAGLPYTFEHIEATYEVTQDKMVMKGAGHVEENKVEIVWESDFRSDAPYGNHLMLQGYGPLSLAERLGLDLKEYLDPSVPIHFKLLYRDEDKGDDHLTVQVDATPLKVNLPWVYYTKQPGALAQFEGIFLFPKEGPFSLQHFFFKAGADKLVGQMLFDSEKSLEKIIIGPSTLGQDKIKSATINRRQPATWEVFVDAKRLDFTPYWRAYVVDDQTLQGEAKEKPSLTLKVKAQSALLNKTENPLSDTSLYLAMDAGVVRHLQLLTAFAGAGKGALNYQAYKGGGATLELKSQNAGNLLSLVDIAEQAKGGDMHIQASKTMEGDWHGHVSMTGFTIQRAPIMARVLSIASITGITDLLNEERGITFSSLSLQFSYSEKLLEIKKAIASSPSIGIRTQGKLWLDGPKPRLKFTGTFSPVNFINGMVSYIPLIGRILGGDEGEGLFAFTFTIAGTPDDPQVSVNPLSLLTPGIFRKMFQQ